MVLPRLTVLDDRYAIGGVLGAAPVVVTYQAWDLTTEQQVDLHEFCPAALVRRLDPTLDLEPLGSDEADLFQYGRLQFLMEAAVLAKLGHPNVVGLADCFEIHGTAYRVFAHHAGAPLASVLARREGGLDVRTACSILLPIYDGLHAAHKRGLLHAAVSPDTVFLSKTSRNPVLLGFRTAHLMLAQRTDRLGACVEEGRSAPEQYPPVGRPGPWTDVYGCAATLYEALAGKRLPAAAQRREHDDVPDLIHALSALPLGMADVLKKALALEPAGRCRSVQAFRVSLQEALDAATTVAVSEPAPDEPSAEMPKEPSVEDEDDQMPADVLPAADRSGEATPTPEDAAEADRVDEAVDEEADEDLPGEEAALPEPVVDEEDDTAAEVLSAEKIDPSATPESELPEAEFPEAGALDGAIPDEEDVLAAMPEAGALDGAIPDEEDVLAAMPEAGVLDGAIPDEEDVLAGSARDAEEATETVLGEEHVRDAVVADGLLEAEAVDDVAEEQSFESGFFADWTDAPAPEEQEEQEEQPSVRAVHTPHPVQPRGPRPRRRTSLPVLAALAVVVLVALTGAFVLMQNEGGELTQYAHFRAQGDSLFEVANYVSARAEYERALAMRPDDGYVSTRLDETRELLVRVGAVRYARFMEQGDSLYVHADSLLKAGSALLSLSLFADAQKAYGEALRYRPDDPLLLEKSRRTADAVSTALQRNRDQQPRETEEPVTDAEAVRAQFYDSYRRQADAAFDEGDLDGARARYTETLSYAPGDAHALGRLARIDAQLTEREALHQAQRHVESGTTFIHQGRFAEAGAEFQRALELDPDDEQAREGLAQAQRQQDTAQHNEQQYRSLREEGDALAGRGSYAEALDSYRRALTFKPRDAYLTRQIDLTQQKALEKDRVLTTRQTEDGVYMVVDQPPQLIGGLEALHRQVRYPEEAVQSGISGRVYVQFVVDEKGAVEQPRVLRGIGGGCDEEALRVVREARFEPGRIAGRPVKTQHTLFVIFSSGDDEE